MGLTSFCSFESWDLAAKIRDLIEVSEVDSLASGGFGNDRGQNEKNLRRKF